MSNNHIVVTTHAVTAGRRAQYQKFFGGEARLSFLAGMPTGQRAQTLSDADVLLSWNLPMELGQDEFALVRNVRLVQLLTAGADRVPYADLHPDTVIACNAGAYAEPVAEHTLAMILTLTKGLLTEHQKMARGEFNWSRSNRRLSGSVCGILGFGGIGRAVARMLRCLDVRIQAINTSGRTDEAADFIGTLDSLQQVLSSSDIIVLSLPLTRSTRGLIGTRELDWMKPDAMLVNVARGAIIDEQALYEHLKANPRFLAGIDAWWREPPRDREFRTDFPFFSLPNVLGSPHNAAMVPGMTELGMSKAAENVNRFLKGDPIAGVVRREDYWE